MLCCFCRALRGRWCSLSASLPPAEVRAKPADAFDRHSSECFGQLFDVAVWMLELHVVCCVPCSARLAELVDAGLAFQQGCAMFLPLGRCARQRARRVLILLLLRSVCLRRPRPVSCSHPGGVCLCSLARCRLLCEAAVAHPRWQHAGSKPAQHCFAPRLVSSLTAIACFTCLPCAYLRVACLLLRTSMLPAACLHAWLDCGPAPSSLPMRGSPRFTLSLFVMDGIARIQAFVSVRTSPPSPYNARVSATSQQQMQQVGAADRFSSFLSSPAFARARHRVRTPFRCKPCCLPCLRPSLTALDRLLGVLMCVSRCACCSDRHCLAIGRCLRAPLWRVCRRLAPLLRTM